VTTRASSLLGIPLLLLLAAPASAQSAIHSVSDAVFVGGRLEPDGAWLFAYDLDVLVTDRSTGISLGPSVSFSFGADGGTDLGRRQEWLLAVDALRARATIVQEHGLRLMAVAGGGVWVASMYEQLTTPRQVILADGTTTQASEHYPSEFPFGGMLTVGAACDWYWDARWALAAYAVGHVRLDQENRMPAFWMELGIGFRLGE
jgi:hypothetical protein